MMKKVLLTAAVLTVLAAAPAMAGQWKSDMVGWYYEYDTGGYAKGGIVEINGEKYCFDANGYMMTGWANVNGEWHYCNSDGRMPIGWIQDGGRWYYFNSDLTMRVGWFDEGKDRYYFYRAEDVNTTQGAVEGAMATGNINLDGVTYYFDASGKQKNMVSSWEQDGISYRYRDGLLQWQNINDKKEWIQFTSKEDLAFSIQEMLIDRYEDKRTYSNSIKFQEEARLMLGRLMTEAEIDEYLDDALEEYWGSNYRRSK
ncbi:MAG: hypothetical protein HFG51_00225 [Lachnospiraceae bacterium]|nr:hypothetical protein [Lachnospiraceae bacterium]